MSLHYGITVPDQSARNLGNTFRLASPQDVKFRRAPTKSVQDVPCGKLLLPGKLGKSRLKFTLGLEIFTKFAGMSRVSTDTV